MASEKEIKILHITDMHFGLSLKGDTSVNKAYHDLLLQYAIETFKGAIQYLIVSGDFGDKCQNIPEVKIWLKKLVEGLGIEGKNVILCAGNHDIVTDALHEYHQEKRLCFDEGLSYATNKLDESEDAVFQSYNEIHLEVTSQKPEFVRNFEDVRFIVLNSSLLSQENRTSSKAKGEGFLTETDPKRIDDVRENYGLVCRKIPVDESQVKQNNDSIYSCSLRYSENLRQQLRITEEFIDNLNAIKDDKLNIVVFHHPESHLHTFERFPSEGIEGSGLYKYISEKGHLLICGHTHPAMHVEVDTSGIFTYIPELIGGPAHIAGHPAHIYCYSFVKENHWNCIKEPHALDNAVMSKKPAFKINLYKSPKPDPTEYFGLETLLYGSDSPTSVSSEKEFRELKGKLYDFLGSEFEKILSTATLGVTKKPDKYQWITVKTLQRQKQIRMHRYQVQIGEKLLTVLVDVIFSDEFVEQNFITDRIEWGGVLNKKTKDTLYIPICLDVLCGCMNPKDVIDYLPKINELMRLTFEKKVFEELEIVFSNLAKSLVNEVDSKISDFVNPLARGNRFFMSSNLLNSVRKDLHIRGGAAPILQFAQGVDNDVLPAILSFR